MITVPTNWYFKCARCGADLEPTTEKTSDENCVDIKATVDPCECIDEVMRDAEYIVRDFSDPREVAKNPTLYGDGMADLKRSLRDDA